jgi:hypothetical protein
MTLCPHAGQAETVTMCVCVRLCVGTAVGEVLLSALLHAQTQMKNFSRLHTATIHDKHSYEQSEKSADTHLDHTYEL